MAKRKKKLDCVEMKRVAGAKLYQRIKGMSAQEQLAFWQKQEQAFAEKYGERIKAIRV